MRINSTPSIQECAHTGRVPQSARLFVCLLWIIAFTSCNDQVSGSLPPFTDFSFEQVQSTQTVLFTADGDEADSYVWSFGDGMDQQTGAFTHHTFCVAGEYDVRLELNGPGGEDSLVKTIVVEPVPGAPAEGGPNLCDAMARRMIVWRSDQPMGTCGREPTFAEVVMDKPNLAYNDPVDRNLSPCDCYGVELPDPTFPQPANTIVHFTHVAPNGNRTFLCEQNEPHALGLAPQAGGAMPHNVSCNSMEPDDVVYDAPGLHSITATPVQVCFGSPIVGTFSAVRQFTIVP